MIKHFWRGGNPEGAGSEGIPVGHERSPALGLVEDHSGSGLLCLKGPPRRHLRTALWQAPGRDAGMVTTVEHRDVL